MPYSIEAYASKFTSSLPALAQEVLDYTTREHLKSHMISGDVQGQLLILLSKMLQPRRILEIGTFTGFSALCLAEGLSSDGLLYTLEVRSGDAATAQAFFDRSAFASQIKLLEGDAAEIIPTLYEVWDLVFIDADKTGYAQYFDLVMPRLRSGGIILADNVLFHGEVLADEIKGKNAKAIAAFNEKIKHSKGIAFTLLTVRDGLMVIRKD